jgi:hypothetical protein
MLYRSRRLQRGHGPAAEKSHRLEFDNAPVAIHRN